MRLINQTKNTILAQEVFLADNSLKRLKGLLGRKDFTAGEALIIKPCSSIHTFFMQFAIDVIFLDKDNRIIKTMSHLKPFRISRPYFHSSMVIELPVGVIQSSSSSPGDILKLE